MKKTVTIAIPVYNSQKYLSETLESVVNQTVNIEEVLISDNRSGDQTIAIVQDFISQNPEINVQINQNIKNLGAVGNFNKCIELCKTDFLVILGSDDRLKPYAIEKQLNLFTKIPELGLVGGIFEPIDSDGKTLRIPEKKETLIFQKGDILEFMKQTAFYMQHSTIMYNMNITRTIGYLDLDYIAPDERFSVKHLLVSPIAQIREAIVESRLHLNQGTNDERLRFKDKKGHFLANLSMAELESTPLRRKNLKKNLNNWIANQCLEISHFVWNNFHKKNIALKYWMFGLKRNPSHYFKRYIYWPIKTTIKNISTY